MFTPTIFMSPEVRSGVALPSVQVTAVAPETTPFDGIAISGNQMLIAIL